MTEQIQPPSLLGGTERKSVDLSFVCGVPATHLMTFGRSVIYFVIQFPKNQTEELTLKENPQTK